MLFYFVVFTVLSLWSPTCFGKTVTKGERERSEREPERSDRERERSDRKRQSDGRKRKRSDKLSTEPSPKRKQSGRTPHFPIESPVLVIGNAYTAATGRITGYDREKEHSYTVEFDRVQKILEVGPDPIRVDFGEWNLCIMVYLDTGEFD